MTPEMIAILGLGVTGLSVAVALAALMVGMFARFEKRIDKRFDEIKEVKERIFSLEQRASALFQRVGAARRDCSTDSGKLYSTACPIDTLFAASTPTSWRTGRK